VLRRADAKGCADIIYTVSYAFREFAGQSYLLRSESRLLIEYLIATKNIIVLDSCFNLANKSYLVDRL